ncbi:MAG: CHAT domain-containing protein [Cytophagaceae bacterium]|nr:CHAT domain-containing protein [Cytophagaceae bacterium]
MLKQLLFALFLLPCCIMAQVINVGEEFSNAKKKYESEDYSGAAKDLEVLLPKLSEVQFEDSSYYMECYIMLGNSYLNLKKQQQSSLYFEKVRRHYANKSNKPNPDFQYFALANLSLMSLEGKNYAETERLLRETMSVLRPMQGEKNEDYIGLLQNLNTTLWNQYKLSSVDSCTSVLLNLNKEAFGEVSLPYAKSVKNLADLRNQQAKYQEAIGLYNKAKKILLDSLGSGNKDYLKLLNSLAHIYESKQQYKEAEEVYLEMAAAYKANQGEKSAEYSDCVYQLCTIYKSQGQYSKAEDLLSKTLRSYKNSLGEKHINYINCLKNLADLYRGMEYYEKAENYYLECSTILTGSMGEKNSNYAALLNNMALLSVDQSKYDIAEQRYQKSLAITKEVLGDRHPAYAKTMVNLAMLYKNTGRTEEAEPLFKKAIQIQKESLGEKHTEYGESLNNFATFYYELGQYKESEKLYQQSLTIIKSVYGEKHPEYANGLNNLATLYEQAGQNEKAENAFRQSMDILKTTLGEDHQQYALTLENLANLYIQDGKLKEADELNTKVLETIKRKLGVNHPNYAFSLDTKGRILEKSEQYAEAEKAYLEVEKIRKSTLGDHHLKYTGSLINLARIYTVKKDYLKALDYWKRALTNYNEDIRQRFTAMSEKEREEFYALITDHFEQFNSFALLAKDQIPQISGILYNVQLETKSLLFRASNKMRQRILSSNNTELIANFNSWLQQKELLSKYLTLPKSQVDKDLDSLERAVNELEKKLETASSEFKDANDAQLRSWQLVQQRLQAGEAAVEMVYFRKFKFEKGGTLEKWQDSSKQSVHYVALLLKPGDSAPSMVVLENASELEHRLIKYYRNVIQFKTKDELCYKNFWEPIKNNLANTKKIYFSPAGVYNQINLVTLLNTSTGKFLLEENDVEILSNTWDLTVPKASKSQSKKVSLFGNPDFGVSANYGGERGATLAPLPGTAQEVNKINATLNSKQFAGTVLTGNQATEENLKSIRDIRIVHIATHGFFKQDKPNESEVNPLLNSGIYLANSIGERRGQEDGILTAFEAMNLNLDNTELVVLSACETGLGASKNGEGVSGLQKAFRVAGAKTVILSLWKVDDVATQKLMSYFYAELVSTGTIGNVRQAFKKAQLKLKEEYSDPKYWGAFVVVGY